MTLVVVAGVDVDLDHPNAFVLAMLGHPLGGYERLG
jgi:hypothetical protein